MADGRDNRGGRGVDLGNQRHAGIVIIEAKGTSSDHHGPIEFSDQSTLVSGAYKKTEKMMTAQNPQARLLNELSQALLRLHKALLDSERLSYERVHGRIASNGAFLQLVLGDSWFAWLRPLSYSITRLDELAEIDRTWPGAELTDLLDSVRSLLTPAEEGEGFARHYFDALQRVPEVGLIHAQVKLLLDPRPAPTRRESDEH